MADSHAASALAHQFEDLEQQHEAASLGMWIFLATEVMFFGGLFAGYTIYRNLYLPGFAAGSHMLNVTIGAINTAVLICSSLTMALAVRAAQMGKRNALVAFLILTMLLGLAFILIKLTARMAARLFGRLCARSEFHLCRTQRQIPGIVFLFLLHDDRRACAAHGGGGGSSQRVAGAGVEGPLRTGAL